jgi:hypothetical protein
MFFLHKTTYLPCTDNCQPVLVGLDTFARHSPTTFPGLDTFARHSPTTFPGLDTFAHIRQRAFWDFLWLASTHSLRKYQSCQKIIVSSNKSCFIIILITFFKVWRLCSGFSCLLLCITEDQLGMERVRKSTVESIFRKKIELWLLESIILSFILRKTFGYDTKN